MGTGQTLALGAIAGLTIFLGLPIGRMQSVSPAIAPSVKVWAVLM